MSIDLNKALSMTTSWSSWELMESTGSQRTVEPTSEVLTQVKWYKSFLSTPVKEIGRLPDLGLAANHSKTRVKNVAFTKSCTTPKI